MEFIRTYQLSIMLFMSGICGIFAFTTLLTGSLSRKRKSILSLMELSAMLLLLFDRASYLYRGDASELGFYMVRISNCLVFFLTIFILHLVTLLLKDMYRAEGGLDKAPVCLSACDVLFLIGTALIVISQFTGLYYSFDAHNTYQRAPGYWISYIVPFLIVLLQEIVILRYRSRLNKSLTRSLGVCLILPTVSSVIQLFSYGVSLTSVTMVLVVIVFYVFALDDLSKSMEQARVKELEFYKEARRREAAMFEQTAEALANAIDAKDKYTRGHSARVATLSLEIAKRAGLSEKDCQQVYFAALLHDVGKIGVRNEILNKVGKLTDEEFEEIKLHPILGNQILSSIRQSPTLSIGAHYHHERYDGKGYPEGLAGEAIPEIARIIAVADAYDAMTSTRSYRASLDRKTVLEEVVRGKGKQFDPKYADILLRIIEQEDPGAPA